MRIGKYIVGLVSGLTFGMLFAPKKGDKLRKEIKKKFMESEDYEEGLKTIGHAFRSAGTEAWDEFKNLGDNEQIASFMALSKEKMQHFLDSAEEQGYDVAGVIQKKLDELAEAAKGKVKTAEKTVKKTTTRASKLARKKVNSAVKFEKTAVKKAKASVSKAKKKVSKKVAATKKSAVKKAASAAKKTTKAAASKVKKVAAKTSKKATKAKKKVIKKVNKAKKKA